jgi:two-component sensor histidine kinase
MNFSEEKPMLQFWEIGECAVVTDNEKYMWIATREHGLIRYDGRQMLRFYPGSSEYSISHLSVAALLDYDERRLMVGTRGGGINVLDKNSFQISVFTADNEAHGLCNNVIGALYRDSFGNLWAGTINGLTLIKDLENADFECFRFDETNELLRGFDNIFMVLHQDIHNPDVLWCGTTGGLKYFDIKEKKFTQVKIPLALLNPGILTPENEVYQIQIRDIKQDSHGVLWMSTWGGGLLSYEVQKDKWSRFNIENAASEPSRALSYNITHGLIWINDSILWVGSHIDPLEFNIKSKKFSVIDFGIPYFRQNNHGRYTFGFHQNEYGLWINTRKSFVRVETENSRELVGTLKINAIRDNLSENLMGRLDSDVLRLNENSKILNFEISIPYFGSKSISFGYRIGNGEWHHFKNPRFTIPIENISTEKIHLACFLDEGKEVLTVKTISIRKHVPLHKKWWFYLLLGAVAFALVLALSYWRMKIFQKELIKQKNFEIKLARSEMQAFRSQMNPHFLFNSLNSIKHYALTRTPYETADYVSKFSLLIRRILQYSQNDVISLSQELESTRLYLEVESLRFENSFEFSIDVDANINPDFVSIPPLILQPYVENALWHGLMHKDGEKGIKIFVSKLNEAYVKICIEDNGIGRERSEQLKKSSLRSNKKSLGMKITQDRINLVKTLYSVDMRVEIIDLFDNNNVSCGTRVEILVPNSIEL